MEKKSIINVTNEIISQSPIGITINFSEITSISFKAKNISNSILKGKINAKHKFNKINIIHSSWIDIYAQNVNVNNSDIKDCSLKNVKFKNCNFNNAAHINNFFEYVNFTNCSFNQTSLTDSEFRNVIFQECDFSHIVISSSRFYQCQFIKCKTSNKFIESSLILDCLFEETDIQTETILENFGININCLKNSLIRIPVNDRSQKAILPQNLDIHNLVNPNIIEYFLLSYFHTPSILMDGSEYIDSTFEYTNWLKLSKNSNRFCLLIERYHEFIMFNYEKNLVPFWMILKLHKMTNNLSESISNSYIDIYRSIMGVHMSLSRHIEEYIQLLNIMLEEYSPQKEIVLLVNGPLDFNFYYNEIPELFEGKSVKIKKVIKHNSPNELHLIWEKVNDLLPIITIFLATRVKFGIQKLVLSNIKEIPEQKKLVGKSEIKSKSNSTKGIDLIKSELGFDKNVNNYIFKLYAIMPGNLILNLQLELRTNIFGKIRKIILDIIPKSVIKA